MSKSCYVLKTPLGCLLGELSLWLWPTDIYYLYLLATKYFCMLYKLSSHHIYSIIIAAVLHIL
jgi:hypothetical protein